MWKILPKTLVLLTIIFYGCEYHSSSSSDEKLYETEIFKKYWYTGKAEVNSYNLNQSRYGEDRKGKAVLIAVTEDFSKKKHVKLDNPENSPSDKVSVLKLNFTKNFITGIYPYSMMLSAFTPVNREQYPSSFKAVMSSQEWCGQVFAQLNLDGNQYAVQSFSYFEQEVDESFSINKTLLEDEIWNIIRLDPDNLPTGEMEVLPGLFFTRLNHIDIQPQRATLSKIEEGSSWLYTITFFNPQRKLEITFEKDFPHKILRWHEQFVEHGKVMHTTATLDKTLYIDYWTKNKNEFLYLRDSLGLSSDH